MHSASGNFFCLLSCLFVCLSSSETQGQLVGAQGKISATRLHRSLQGREKDPLETNSYQTISKQLGFPMSL